MLSDEERKAINDLRKTIEYYNKRFKESPKITNVLVDNFDVNNLFILLSLIEKQSKEIEELKKQDLSNSKIIANMSERHFHDREKIRNYEELQDKIKAKIEPVLKQLERKMQEEYNKYGNSREYQDIVDAYNFLQSLLEKE